MSVCVICGAAVDFPFNVTPGELIECVECGGELEVIRLEPLELAEAPCEEEDWGQ